MLDDLCKAGYGADAQRNGCGVWVADILREDEIMCVSAASTPSSDSWLSGENCAVDTLFPPCN